MSKISLAFKIAVIVLVVISYIVIINGELNEVHPSQIVTDGQINDTILTNMDAHKNLSYILSNKTDEVSNVEDIVST